MHFTPLQQRMDYKRHDCKITPGIPGLLCLRALMGRDGQRGRFEMVLRRDRTTSCIESKTTALNKCMLISLPSHWPPMVTLLLLSATEWSNNKNWLKKMTPVTLSCYTTYLCVITDWNKGCYEGRYIHGNSKRNKRVFTSKAGRTKIRRRGRTWVVHQKGARRGKSIGAQHLGWMMKRDTTITRQRAEHFGYVSKTRKTRTKRNKIWLFN